MAEDCLCRIGGRRIKLNKITVEPVLFFYMFGSFLQFPTFQALVYKKTCLENFNQSFCDDMDNKTYQKLHRQEQDTIQGEASHWIMLSNVGMTLPSIFVVFFFIGSWGDKVNRKFPVLLPCVGALVYNLCNLLNAQFMHWPLDFLMIGPVFNGLFGGYITLLMGVYSYITYVSSPSEKTIRVGIVESMTFFAGTISVFVSGLLLTAAGFVGVFAIVCGCVGLASCHGLFLLKSIRPETPQATTGNWLNFWFIESIKDTFLCMTKSRVDRSKVLLCLQILVINIIQMCTTGEGDILFLYLKRSPRSFTSTQYGYFKGTENLTRSVALLTILPLMKHWLHFRDSTIVIIGIVSKAAGLILLGFANDLTLVFLVVIFAMFQGFPAAGLRSSMSGMVETNEQGRLFALVAATESCVTLTTTFIFNGWYPYTLSSFDGTCFEFAAGLCGMALVVMIYIHIQTKDTASQEGVSGNDISLSSSPAPKTAAVKQKCINFMAN